MYHAPAHGDSVSEDVFEDASPAEGVDPALGEGEVY